MALDTNGDGTLTLSEINAAPLKDQRRNRDTERWEPLLAADPNQDGRLTMEEL
jgi:EF hand